MADAPSQMTELARTGFATHCQRVAAWSLALEHAEYVTAANVPEIIELAEALDEHFAWEPFSEPDESPNPLAEIALNQLQVIQVEELDQAIRKLPVFPAVAQRALQVLLGDRWSGAQLEKIASADQTLATQILATANSWALSPRQRISSLSHAIAYIGAERASRILYAASIRQMFSSARFREIWHHSLAAAQAAEALAGLTDSIDPKEAFLAGLVHDIGRLAMARLPDKFQKRLEYMVQIGCEPFRVERILCGFSHAQAGARALRLWSFPDHFIEAVEFHHQPEKSKGKLASLLFLTEHWTGAQEDVPSLARLLTALERLGLKEDSLDEFETKEDRSMAGLRFG
jgi:putative nucleotidyltransferase with HDIG domain